MKKALFVFLFLAVFVSAACAGDLADVQEAGIIRYGTHGDGLPFTFIDQNGDVSGIDIELMKEVARRMDVKLDVYEMAPDSLQESLAAGQVDVIGGALSRRSDRNASMSYSTVYYTAVPVFVGPADDMPDEDQMNESLLAGMPIGVQRGSGFEKWLKTDLLKDGIVQEKNIYVYSRVADAMRAMARGRIEMVLMDANIYQILYADSGNFRTWTYGNSTDDYVFGVRRGSDLRAEINRHLTAILNEGDAQTIADRFFNLNYSSPVESVAVPVSDEPGSGDSGGWFTGDLPTLNPVVCTPSGAFLDETVPDGTSVAAGSSFRKTWTLRNTGTCDWTQDYVFAFLNGERMGGRDQNLPSVVRPGETIEIGVDMVAPDDFGLYRGYWQLRTPQGQDILDIDVAEGVWVEISVRP